MTIWYVHRRADRSIASAHQEPQPGYAEEALDDQAGELAGWFATVRRPLPREVRPLQLRRALRQLGKLDQVKAYVAAQSEEVREAWQFAIAIPSNDRMVTAAAAALGIDADALFQLAGSMP